MTKWGDRIIADVLAYWGLELSMLRPDISIPGSPDRSLSRIAVETVGKDILIVENIAAQTVPHKHKIARSLAFLAGKKLPAVHEYRSLPNNEFIAVHQGFYWQIQPYIEGIPLKRTEYAEDDWRGTEMAVFLGKLYEHSQGIPSFDRSRPFSIVLFIRDFMEKLKQGRAELYERISPFTEYLESCFADKHNRIPVSFCHGDYHPLNVIWGEKKIMAVIDWEFLGYMPEIYDAAMLVGCLGMENPRFLAKGMTMAFLRKMKELNLISDIGWTCFFEMVLAQRFAWLSDWMRRSDVEMIDLESVYIRLLFDNRNALKKSWEI